MLYRLSKLIPVRFRTQYAYSDSLATRATWWQWRDRIFRYRELY